MKKGIIAAAALSIAVSLIGSTVKAADMSDYVRMNDKVSYSMTSAQYWIGRSVDTDKVLHTPEEIAKINSLNPPTENVGEYNMSLYEIKDTVDGGFVRAIFSEITAPADPEAVYLYGKPTTEGYWQKLTENADAGSVPDTVNVRFGYSTARSSLRMFPSYDFIGQDKDDRFYDVMVMSEYMPFRPLVVLHESKDGEWYYVMFEGYSGWVNKKYVALCPDREDWLARMQPEDFLIVTGREIRLQDDVKNPSLSGQLLPMGTKLPLLKKADIPEFINDRETTACYVVKLPVRAADGMITDRYSLISVKEDVNIGYLDYTSENVLKLSLKRLGDRYGWAGLGRSNDCSGMTCEIFRCFGIELPRVSGQIAAFEGVDTHDVSDMTDAQKKELLETVPAGSVLYFRGHIMIYLGMYDSSPYCISASGTYFTADGDTKDTNSVIITNMDEVYRADGKTWLGELSKVITL